MSGASGSTSAAKMEDTDVNQSLRDGFPKPENVAYETCHWIRQSDNFEDFRRTRFANRTARRWESTIVIQGLDLNTA